MQTILTCCQFFPVTHSFTSQAINPLSWNYVNGLAEISISATRLRSVPRWNSMLAWIIIQHIQIWCYIRMLVKHYSNGNLTINNLNSIYIMINSQLGFPNWLFICVCVCFCYFSFCIEKSLFVLHSRHISFLRIYVCKVYP